MSNQIRREDQKTQKLQRLNKQGQHAIEQRNAKKQTLEVLTEEEMEDVAGGNFLASVGPTLGKIMSSKPAMLVMKSMDIATIGAAGYSLNKTGHLYAPTPPAVPAAK